MLETLLKLYAMSMQTKVTSPLPHLVGPPGCGKSTTVKLAADICGVRLHTINVSRLSPLEIEGVEMPVPFVKDKTEELRLQLLHSPIWKNLKDGDFVLWDEFLRGFPEVYNGLLDIFTSREVAGFELPNVFMVGASNSTVSYDKALDDRLLHILVEDPRSDAKAKAKLAQLLVDGIGLLPDMVKSYEMSNLLDNEVLPMFHMLDAFKKNTAAPASTKGSSIRKLIGQAKLRHVESLHLSELIQANNAAAMRNSRIQYTFLLDGRSAKAWPQYVNNAEQVKDSPKLSPLQRENLQLNLELIRLEEIRKEKGVVPDAPDPDDIFAD